jgi:hypothetical protein
LWLATLLGAIPVSAAGAVEENDLVGIDRIGADFEFHATNEDRWPQLEAAVEALTRSRLEEQLILLSVDEAERAQDPVLEIGLSIVDVENCPSAVVTLLRMALTRDIVLDASARHLMADKRRISMWERNLWFEAPTREPWPRIRSTVQYYVGEFTHSIGSANVGLKQMSLVNIAPWDRRPAPIDRDDSPGTIPIGFSFGSHSTGESRWPRLEASLETRALSFLQEAGFTVLSGDDADKSHSPSLNLYLTIVEFEECPRTVVAILKLALTANVSLDRPAEYLLRRGAVTVWDNLLTVEVRRADPWPEIDRALDSLLAGFAEEVGTAVAR